MPIWDFRDPRYRRARILSVLSLGGVIGTAVGLWFLLQQKAPPPDVAMPTEALAILKATPTPTVSPETQRQRQIDGIYRQLVPVVQAKDWAKIEVLSREILKLNPQDDRAWSLLACAREANGDPTEAIDFYGRAARFSQERAPVNLYLRAKLFVQKKDWQAATQSLEEAAKLDLTGVGIESLLLLVKVQNGRGEEIRNMIRANEQAGVSNQRKAWLFGGAALALQDGDVSRGAGLLAQFQQLMPPAVYSDLIETSFFDPYREQVELKPYLTPLQAR